MTMKFQHQQLCQLHQALLLQVFQLPHQISQLMVRYANLLLPMTKLRECQNGVLTTVQVFIVQKKFVFANTKIQLKFI